MLYGTGFDKKLKAYINHFLTLIYFSVNLIFISFMSTKIGIFLTVL